MTAPTAVATPRRPAPLHLDAIDVVRVLTVALVIGVHVVAGQPGGVGLANGVLLTVMHVSRQVFFLLTAFVLAYSYRDRAPSRWSVFWRRRYLLVGVPYLVWSAAYFIADYQPLLPAGHALGAFAQNVAAGTARYHLYFLLVTMQMYLVFPLLRRLLRGTRRWHGWLLAAAATYQLGFYALVERHTTAGPLTDWLRDPSPYLFSYLGFVIAGGVAAGHAEAFLAWTRTRARRVYAGCAVTIAVGMAVFLVRVWHFGQSPLAAGDVFQPVIVAESVAIAWAFLALGLAWQDRGTPGRRLVRAGSDASFGVYLAHPLLLQGLLALSAATGLTALAVRTSGLLVTAVSTVVVVPLLYLTCAVLAEAARRTPLSLPLTGRTRRRPPPATQHHPDRQPVPVAAPVPTSTGGMRCETQPA